MASPLFGLLADKKSEFIDFFNTIVKSYMICYLDLGIVFHMAVLACSVVGKITELS